MSEKAKKIIENLETAKFRCYFPECKGLCCKNGRPGLSESEITMIEANIEKFKPLLRPESLSLLDKSGFMTKRKKEGRRTLARAGGWCIFSNEGCVLQKIGASEGEKWKYKPSLCVLFPVSQDLGESNWYIRQKGYKQEAWDLFCLERTPTEKTHAVESLKDEIEYLEKHICKLQK
ncbi:MAG: DUF3109 family protein [Candidatus Riflebacteria bacterium]|nr:DUF3109 family protein [Candidatus Riflebacteria bacterium]